MKLRDSASWLPNHLDRARRLGPSLGPTLVQLPPRWKRNTERLDEFLTEAVRLGGDLRWAVELREATWLHDDTYDVLRRHGAALCLHDMLADHPVAADHRLDLHPLPRPRRPEPQVLGPLHRPPPAPPGRASGRWLAGGCDVYAYFNNDYEGNAVARRPVAQEAPDRVVVVDAAGGCVVDVVDGVAVVVVVFGGRLVVGAGVVVVVGLGSKVGTVTGGAGRVVLGTAVVGGRRRRWRTWRGVGGGPLRSAGGAGRQGKRRAGLRTGVPARPVRIRSPKMAAGKLPPVTLRWWTSVIGRAGS